MLNSKISVLDLEKNSFWLNDARIALMIKTIGKILPLVLLIFIGFGDRFLPKPLSDYSAKTRHGINNFVIGMFPDKNLKNPYQKSDDAVKQAEDDMKRSGGQPTP